jgi:F0F1-type ATP synthase membrane subunit b/b'
MNERQMTKGERDDLCRLVKQRERVAKTAAEQRSAAMLAEFEQQISAQHSFNNNDVWKAAVDAAVDAAKKANEAVVAEADKLGIPREFQPKLHFNWARRGENEYRERREELRRVAKAEIDALEKVARVQIESQSVQAQTEIIANGLSSEAAIAFLNRLPAIESMMPALDVTDIQAKLAERARNKMGYRGPYLLGQDDS